MSELICLKCNKKFETKFNLNRHLKRKNPCFKELNNTINILNIHPKSSKNTQKNEKNDDFCCKFCEKTFLNNYNLNKHIRNNCKIKKQQDQEKETIFKQLVEKDNIINKLLAQNQLLITEISKLKQLKTVKNITNNTINNTNNTIINNPKITLINYGKEDLKIIDNKHYEKIIKNYRISGVKVPDEILKLIHFNSEYPQLNNIYISDFNREKCMIYDNNEWILSPINQISNLIDKIVRYSYEKKEELEPKYKKNKEVIKRLNIIDKYIKMNDDDYVNEIIENDEPDCRKKVKKCKEFQQYTQETIKKTLYNEGKKLKKKSLKCVK